LRVGGASDRSGVGGVSENLDEIPEHKSKECTNVQVRNSIHERGYKKSPKTAHASKVVNPFTIALTPPFIGRRRDFYILKIPSNLRNIPSVNMYMNVLYIP
jgi:hypothetical protein